MFVHKGDSLGDIANLIFSPAKQNGTRLYIPSESSFLRRDSRHSEEEIDRTFRATRGGGLASGHLECLIERYAIVILDQFVANEDLMTRLCRVAGVSNPSV